MMFKNVEIRKLPAGSLFGLVDILEINSDWKILMSLIPKDLLNPPFEPKYNNEHIGLIEESSKATGKKCTEILFEEWGSSGKVRPTLSILQDIVLQADLYRAADMIALMLQEPPPLRPTKGPAARVDTNISLILKNESLEAELYAMDPIKYSYLVKNSNNKVTRKIDDKTVEHTTVPMESTSNLVKIVTNMESADVPNVSALHSLSDKTTAKIDESDMIKFSAKLIPDNCSLETTDVPKFSAILTTSSQSGTDLPTKSMTSNSVSIDSSMSQSSQDATGSATAGHSMEMYQTSLPNIDLESSSVRSRSGIDSSILQDSKLTHFQYTELEEITNNFSAKLIKTNKGLAGRIGSGGFGEVFMATHNKYGVLAIKKAHNYYVIDHKPDIATKIFNAEVRNLSQFRHKNIVPILGYSIDGPGLCIVCEYVEGGSLEERIGAKTLTERQRLNIMLGTAEGLKYLHRSDKPDQDDYKSSESDDSNIRKNNFVHGDVKSANILLTRDCIPKLCDFGLAKQFDSTFITTSPMGTSAYMAPEGFSGTITQKIDIYSYGVVLLELLTGLRPIITNNSEKLNIKDYVEENCVNNKITNLLDPVVPQWTKADEVFKLATKCLERLRKNRPSIEDVCDILYAIN